MHAQDKITKAILNDPLLEKKVNEMIQLSLYNIILAKLANLFKELIYGR